ncbi:MAG: hypothetical protein AAF587_00865 [Bacteroidota bacterium]
MEFDELKTIWQSHTATLVEIGHRSAADIGHMLRQRSRTALSKINRSIGIEIGILLAFALLSVWQLVRQESSLDLLAIIMLCFVGASMIFYSWKYRRLNRISIETSNLKEALSRTTMTMAGYMKLYSYAGMILVPAMGAAGVLYGVHVAAQDNGKTLSELPMSAWGIIVLVMSIYAGLSILFTKWYVRKLYGVHYDELKACLEELQESTMP